MSGLQPGAADIPLPREGAQLAGLSGLLKRAGVRVTHPRLMVLGLLAESRDQALGANDLYQMMLMRRHPMSLSTIYSVLQTFKQHRLVSVRYLDDGVQGFTCLDD